MNIEFSPPQGIAHQIEVNLSLLDFLGKGEKFNRRMEAFLTPEERGKARDVLEGLGIDGYSFLVGIHPGGRRDKKWDIGKFAALARKIKTNYGFPIIIFRGPVEKDILFTNQGSLSQWGVLLPGLELREFASILSHCRIFISGDCGPMHLASALSIPTLSVFLVKNSYRYAPQGPHHRVVCRKDPAVEDLLAEFDSLVKELKG